MKLKDTIILIILIIFTLGIYGIIVFKNRNKEETNNKLSSDSKLTLNLKSIIKNLGNEDNILGAESTITKVKVWFKNKDDVNTEELKKVKGVSGLFFSSKYIVLIVGKQAKILAKKLVTENTKEKTESKPKQDLKDSKKIESKVAKEKQVKKSPKKKKSKKTKPSKEVNEKKASNKDKPSKEVKVKKSTKKKTKSENVKK